MSPSTILITSCGFDVLPSVTSAATEFSVRSVRSTLESVTHSGSLDPKAFTIVMLHPGSSTPRDPSGPQRAHPLWKTIHSWLYGGNGSEALSVGRTYWQAQILLEMSF